jgi:hypothetical protein
MTKDEFVAKEIRAATMLMDAVDIVRGLISVYTDLQAELLLDQIHTDCGNALQSVITALGSGPTSNSAKINRLRL